LEVVLKPRTPTMPSTWCRTESICERCGISDIFDLPPFHEHHDIIPFRDGGEETQLLCPWCHAKAHEEKGEKGLGRLIRGQIKAWQDGQAIWMVWVAGWKLK